MKAVIFIILLFFLSLSSVSFGGPFDVSIRSLKSTVSPGEDLTFEINITNADATDYFDANVTYWIDDGSNYRSSSSVRVFAGTITILGRIFNILYDEPGGVHVLRVSVAYPSITSPATAETTFTVTETVTTTTSPAAGGGVTQTTIAKEIAKIDIIDYPKEVEVERGWMKYANLKVNNTGSTVLNNIKLSIAGVPSDWLEITPEQIKYLMHDASENFSLRLAVPVTAKPGNYPINLTVTSEASTSVSSIIRVFSSNAELILFNLETIRNRLSELENATLKAESAGRNVTAIMNMLYEIKDMVRIAEKYTDMNDYDTALAMIKTIKDMLDKAGTELEISQIIASRPLETSYLLLIIIIIVILIVVIYWLNKRMKLFEKSMKQYIFETKRLVVGRKTVTELQKEKGIIEKMLKILKKEYDEGLISKNSYEELKNNNEKRLSEIERKIGVKA
ncbi:MAG: NEW3 domain-containing protein [Candidatus Aenigmarchaeota archaeon]|nr:NEW3 domain-containing protein [Candidatus Aenigmarchaeota archaeon]